VTEYGVNYLVSEIAMHSREITEFWLACSFAVIVAATYAPEKLDKKFYRFIGTGYFVSSLVFVMLRISHFMLARERLLESPFHDGQSSGYYLQGVAGTLLLLLMVFGTVAVLYYLKSSVISDRDKNR
jgi:hypothetical protein